MPRTPTRPLAPTVPQGPSWRLTLIDIGGVWSWEYHDAQGRLLAVSPVGYSRPARAEKVARRALALDLVPHRVTVEKVRG